MSDSVRPQRRQPSRLPRPQDSPGKNTGVGCHVLLQCMKVKSESEVAQLCPTLRDPIDCSLPGSSIHGIFQARVLEWGAIAFSELHINVLRHKQTALWPRPHRPLDTLKKAATKRSSHTLWRDPAGRNTQSAEVKGQRKARTYQHPEQKENSQLLPRLSNEEVIPHWGMATEIH